MPSLILLTGVNGMVGSHVALQALREGYHLRAAVRRAEATKWMEDSPIVRDFISQGSLTTVVIPDMSAIEAFVAAARGCSYIIHTAGPVPIPPCDPENLEDFHILSTRAVLHAAESTPSVKRVVFTSSIHAILTLKDVLVLCPEPKARMNGDFSGMRTLTADDTVLAQDNDLKTGAPIDYYQAGKIASRKESLEYMKTHPESTFTIVNLLPGNVFGPSLTAKTKREFLTGVNFMLSFMFMDLRIPDYAMGAECVHIKDAAEAHIKALTVHEDERVQNFLLATDGPRGPVYADAVDIVKQEMPGLAATLPFSGHIGRSSNKYHRLLVC